MLRVRTLSVVFVVALTSLVAVTDVSPALAVTGTTVRTSLTDADVQTDAPSWAGDVSTAGNVAFTSAAVLAGTDGNDVADVFVRAGSATILVSRSSGTTNTDTLPADSPVISDNGELIAFRTDNDLIGAGDNNDDSDIYLFDRDSNDNDVLDDSAPTVTLISRNTAGVIGNDASDQPAISPNGRYVAFRSMARNLVTHDHNGLADIFVRDLVTSTTYRASTDASGNEANGASAAPSVATDATHVYVAFETFADNLTTPDDGNTTTDIVRWGRTGAGIVTIDLVSRSAEGTYANGPSSEASLSGDGSKVAFTSEATDLIASDSNNVSDVFVRDMASSSTTRISVQGASTQANARSDQPNFASGVSYVAFRSWATNLVAGDTNGFRDIFVRALATNTSSRVSLTSADLQVAGRSYDPAISSTSEYVVFHSDANDVIGSDTNSVLDVFRRQRDVTAPVITSLTPDASHPTGTTSWQSPMVQVTIAASDGLSGVDGFSVLWNTTAGSDVDTVKDKEETPTTITSPTLSTSATNYLHIRAVDNAGNWSGVSHLGPWKMDGTVPTLTASVSPVWVYSSFASIARSNTLTLSWTASDAHSGLAGFEVWYKRAAYNRATQGYEASVKYKTLSAGATSTTLSGAAGYTYVVTVIAKDKVGNAKSKQWKIAFPLDDPSVPKSGGWTTLTSSLYYGGEASKTTATGPYMQLSVKYPMYVVALATKCSSCGTFHWRANGYDVGVQGLDSSSTTHNVGVARSVLPTTTSVGLQSFDGGSVIISGFGIVRAG